MNIQEKIRFMRKSKNLSQEKIASRLNMSTYGYSKIERGETKANMPKLEQISEALEIDLMELLTFGEKNVACLIADNNSTNSNNNILQTENTSNELAFEIEKLQLIIEHQKQIITSKDKEISQLEEMLAMQKKINQIASA